MFSSQSEELTWITDMNLYNLHKYFPSKKNKITQMHYYCSFW